MIGADYSAGRPGGAALAAAGVKAVGRYAAAGRPGINVTAAEVRDLRAHGIDVFVYNEHEAGYMLGGAARAATTVPGAVKVCRDAGLPDGPIFYAVDFDATRGGPPTSAAALADMRKLADFLTAAARITGWDAVGVYGGYYVVEWLLDNLPGLRHAVQTSAWSAGRWEPRAFCRQDGYNWTINGVNCDHLTITDPDEGSLRYRTGVDDMSAADVAELKAYIDSKIDDHAKAVWAQKLASGWNGGQESAQVMLARAEQYAIEAGYPYNRPKGNDHPGTPTHASLLQGKLDKAVGQTDTLEASEAAQSQALTDAAKSITDGVVAQLLGSGIGGIDEPKLRQVVGDAVHGELAGTEFVARPVS
jgi:hypothetical protein